MSILERIVHAQSQAHRLTGQPPTTLFLGNAEYLKLLNHMDLKPAVLPPERLMFMQMMVFRVDAATYLKATP
jgi:hypothetical protein